MRAIEVAVSGAFVALVAAGVLLGEVSQASAEARSRPLQRLTVEVVSKVGRDKGPVLSGVAVTGRSPRVGRLPRLRSTKPVSGQLEVLALGASSNQILARRIVSDPTLIRADFRSRRGRLTGRTIVDPSSELVVDLPANPAITRIRIRRSRGPSLTTSVLSIEAPPVAPPAPASVVALRTTGDAQNRVDIAILGDGYTAGQLDRFADDARQFTQAFFAEPPFTRYLGLFNVTRVDVISSESGADHLESAPTVLRDTALGANYGCFAVARLLCVDTATVESVVNTSLGPSQHDIVIVLVNDDTYGGSGGIHAVASRGPQSREIALHEIGHSFGLLADEYVTAGIACTPNEPLAPNLTRTTDRAGIRWRRWIDPATELPTVLSPIGGPGVYAGGGNCAGGYFRPLPNSKMQILGTPFGAINSEQLVRRIYSIARPVDETLPNADVVRISRTGSARFSLSTPDIQSPALTIGWTIDGVAAGTGNSTEVTPGLLGSGRHAVEVVVIDPTDLVRGDPDGLLRSRRTWTLEVERPRPQVTSVAPLSAIAGTGPITLTVTGSDFVPDTRLLVGGERVPTTVISPVLIEATLPASLAAAPAVREIRIETPEPGGGISAATTFEFTAQPIAPPVSLAPPGIEGRAEVAATLHCARGTWTGSPTLYTYRWIRDGQPAPDATSADYVVGQADRGATIRCVVSGANAGGVVEASSSPVGPVGPSPFALGLIVPRRVRVGRPVVVDVSATTIGDGRVISIERFAGSKFSPLVHRGSNALSTRFSPRIPGRGNVQLRAVAREGGRIVISPVRRLSIG